MKVCHFISSIGLGRGEFYIDLVNEMVNINNVEITLLIPKNAKYLHRISKKIKVIEYYSKDSRNNPFLYIELFKIFKKNSFDIVHTHFGKASEIFFRLNKIFNFKHIATKHNPRKGKIFSKIKYVTAVSDDVSKSIKNNKSQIIYNGVTPIKVNEENKNDVFTISAIGRLDKIKGFDKLISEVAKTKSKFILNIVGDGEEQKNLESLINKLELNDKINLVGFKTDIPQILADSDLIIMTSLSEGFSLVMVESLFYSKLFISTKVSGCKDILDEKLLINDFDIAEKIDDVIENYEAYVDEYKKVKNKYKEKFLLKNIVNEYIEYYENVKGKNVK